MRKLNCWQTDHNRQDTFEKKPHRKISLIFVPRLRLRLSVILYKFDRYIVTKSSLLTNERQGTVTNKQTMAKIRNLCEYRSWQTKQQQTKSWASAHRGKWGQWMKIKKRKRAKKSSFLNGGGCGGEGRCRERRYADHMFIQIAYTLECTIS